MTTFTEVIIENDATTAELEIYARLEAAFAGWEPAEGNLEVWLAKAFARLSSILRQQAAETSTAVFRRFGETIANIPPILAAPATVTSTWRQLDTAGYTIPAGTIVNIAVTGETVAGFEVVSPVTIAPGSQETAAGEVLLRAVVPGAAGNGLTASPEPSTSNAATTANEWVHLVGATGSGVDAETEDEYLVRLTEELQLLSLSLIVEEDFAKDARTVPFVGRAICIPAFNGATLEANKPLVETVFATDAFGLPLTTGEKAELKARQQAKVPSGVLCFVNDATYTEVDVEASVVAIEGFALATVEAAVLAKLGAYLSPANWGTIGSGEGEAGPGAWLNATTVYLNELISECDRVAGVRRVVSVKLAKHSTTKVASDLALTGPVALTKPATLTVAVA